MTVLLMLTAAALCGYALQAAGVTGGLVLGAMVGSAAVMLARGGGGEQLPGPLRDAALVIVGASVGAGITREVLGVLRTMALPALGSAVLMICAGIAVALLLRALGAAPPQDLLATSPGALSAVIGVAVERGEGAPVVAAFHAVRVFLVLATLPLLVALLDR